ncbi:MAG: UDP-N-acetylmuramoyl-L-alanine--D-glutamate ligase [Methylophilales bacterium]|nr:UDP-N-acetylmuramoyl-L-alanine--D-glutamate ligase [Methylophilales bacterium]
MTLELKNKQVLVLGLGDTGLSALRWLKSQGARLSVADTRETPPSLDVLRRELPDVITHLGEFKDNAFIQPDLIVISPGVPLSTPQVQTAIARGIPVVGDVELFAQHRPKSAKVIAITGSNGKSTVTTLVGEMCKDAGLKTIVAGNIGLPVLDTLAMTTPDVYVLELSSFQLETTSSLNADSATVLNVTEDHLDRYETLAQYAAAKARIFKGSGIQVLNRQDDFSRNMALNARPQLSFGLNTPIEEHEFGITQQHFSQGKTMLMAVSNMKIAGLHNASNALAALALCHSLKLEYATLLNTLSQFKGLPHRVEWVSEVHGVTFYDDSKGTNVGATCAALAGLPQKVVLIAGGDGKGQDFSPLRSAVSENSRAVILLGRDAPLIAKALQDSGVPLIHVSTMEEAVTQAYQAAQKGDAVLLSPACASFDMFRNYQHRAESFIAAVHDLENESRAAA